jgi:hypothetical protein
MGRWRLVVVGCVAVLGLAGCTQEQEEPAPDRVTHPPAAVPKDRDPKAVLAAVRQLDLCAVLATGMAATPGLPVAPARSVAYAPFGCEALQGSTFSVSTAVEPFGSNARKAWPMRPLGGAKVYLRGGAGTCDAALPISFNEAVTIRLRWVGAPAEPCKLVESIATSAVGTLDSPTAGRVAARWDACGVLRSAVRDRILTEEIGMDGCATDPVGLSFNLTGPPAADQPKTDKVSGVDVTITQGASTDRGCSLTWLVGPPPPTADPTWQGRYAVLDGADCDRLKEIAAKAMTVLASAPPADPAPQTPLLYRTDEPDAPFPGACAWILALRGQHCEPYVEVPVPKGRAEVVRAAQADPNVHCAVALTAVRKYLGQQFVPVTQADEDPHHAGECVFAEPERRIQVAFSLWDEVVAEIPDDQAVDPARVRGHAGYAKRTDDYYEMWLGLTNNGDDPGMVRFYLSDGGVGANDFIDYTDKVAPILTEIMATYLA